MNSITLQLLSFLLLFILTSNSIITANTIIQKIEIKSINPKIQEIIEKINETVIRNYMEYLVLEIGSRYTGTYGCEKAANYIFQQFQNMGIQTRYQNWSAWGNRWNPGLFKSQNVIGTKLGTDQDSDEIIIFNAHYDTIKETVGAIDDGSGTVGVLAAAYILSQYNFKRTIEFVAFSGEEIGLCGSHIYARELYDQQTPVLVEFNADGIGQATSKESGKKIRLSITEDSRWIANIMETMTKDYGFNFNITKSLMNRDAKRGGSDYFEFIQLGYESVAVWQAEWGNTHSPLDNINNVNISYLINTTRHIAATIAILADIEIEKPQIHIANPRFGKIFFNDNEKKIYKYKKPIIIDETNIYAEVKQGSYQINKVEFYYDNKLLFTDTEKPYEYMLNKISFGFRFHKIKVIAYDTIGNNATDEIKIFFINILKNN